MKKLCGPGKPAPRPVLKTAAEARNALAVAGKLGTVWVSATGVFVSTPYGTWTGTVGEWRA